MIKTFNSAVNKVIFAGVSAAAIGTALHQYGASYEKLCDAGLGSNFAASVAEIVTGKNVSSAGHWQSASGSAFCDAVGTTEKVGVKVANSLMNLGRG